MKNSSAATLLAGLITLGIVGTNLAGEKNPDCPLPYQNFDMDAFTPAEAQLLWPTGADAYATQEEAALDFPDHSLEAFFWSNVVIKEGTLQVLQAVDFDGDGQLCMKYVVKEHGHYARLFADFRPALFVYLWRQRPMS